MCGLRAKFLTLITRRTCSFRQQTAEPRATTNGITVTRVSPYETAFVCIRRQIQRQCVLFSSRGMCPPFFFIQTKVRIPGLTNANRYLLSDTRRGSDARRSYCRRYMQSRVNRKCRLSTNSQPHGETRPCSRSEGTKLYGAAAAKWRPGRGNFRTRIVVFRYVGIQANRGHGTAHPGSEIKTSIFFGGDVTRKIGVRSPRALLQPNNRRNDKIPERKVSSIESFQDEGANATRYAGPIPAFRMGNERLKYEALTREPVWITASAVRKVAAISGGITCPGNLKIKSYEVYRYVEESLSQTLCWITRIYRNIHIKCIA